MIVFGLGNPGSEYLHTRHNAGFDVIDKTAAFFQKSLKKRCFRLYRYLKISEKDILVEPLTYMNNSGNVIKYFKKKITNPSEVVVICDNMDLAVGGLRIRQNGGSSGQKGLNSIASNLGSNDFIRIYVGIGRPDENTSVADHVLSREENPEKKKAYEEALEEASKALRCLIEGKTVEEVQRDFNRKGLL